MQAARERLNLSLSVTTKPEALAADGSNRGVKPSGIKMMSAREMAKRYRLGEQVMESTNTGMDVVKAIRREDGLQVVVKTRKRPESFKSPEVEREWRRTTEVQLGMPQTERLCQFYEVIETDTMYYVVMEKVEGKDLFEVMGETPPTPEEAREIVRQTLEGLDVLHRQGRIHKDLKIENVMVDLSPKTLLQKLPQKISSASLLGVDHGGLHRQISAQTPATAKLIDFDTVEDWEPTSPKAKEVLGTDGYIAPEAYLGEYSPASDIYAAGVVMYKVLSGEFPSRDELFDDLPGQNWVGSPQMKRIHERLKTERADLTVPPFDKDHAAADLCAKLLAFEAIERPSAEEALKHEWFLVRSPG